MTPKLTVRSFSDDQFILDKVFYSNAYMLKGMKNVETQPVIVDIGAHCGYFTFAALALGAKKIYAFEPFIENYKILLPNIEAAEFGKIIPYNFGVYTAEGVLPFAYPEVEKAHYRFSDINIDVKGESDNHHMGVCLTLDYILNKIIREDVDILKINIGYAEKEILFGSKLLALRVNNICLECDTIVAQELIEGMKSKGFVDSFVQVGIEEEQHRSIVILSKTKCSDLFAIG
jgi:FkbM family methyltransferase